jgi:hypothetical protein
MMAAPTRDVAITKVIAVTGAMAHRAPTRMLEIKSPMPFTVASTPNPVPRTSAGRYVAALVLSTVSQNPM